MNFQREVFTSKLIEEMRPLWNLHFQEIINDDQLIDPNLNVYERAHEGGLLRIFTARMANLLVGYNVFCVSPHPHFKGSKQAVQDLLFLRPDMRAGLDGYHFMKWCDEQLEAEGVDRIYQHFSVMNNISPLMKRMGYTVTNLVYVKKFKGGK